MMKDLILFPFNGNAKEALPVLEALNERKKEWNLLGFIDDDLSLKGKTLLGIPVLGGRDQLKKHPQARVLAVPGRPDNYHKRQQLIDSLNLSSEKFATLIHPSAQIGKDTSIGHNVLIMAGVVTTVQVKIGNHCVILPNTVLSHDVNMGDYSLIGSNVSISGFVKIEPLCYIGTGTKIIQEVTIASKTLIGIGSVVLNSTKPNSIWVGDPARFLRENI